MLGRLGEYSTCIGNHCTNVTQAKSFKTITSTTETPPSDHCTAGWDGCGGGDLVPSQGPHSNCILNSQCFPCPTANFPCADFIDLRMLHMQN